MSQDSLLLSLLRAPSSSSRFLLATGNSLWGLALLSPAREPLARSHTHVEEATPPIRCCPSATTVQCGEKDKDKHCKGKKKEGSSSSSSSDSDDGKKGHKEHKEHKDHKDHKDKDHKDKDHKDKKCKDKSKH
ncbi:unnamed protein product [Lampetra fluviatilis]